MLCHRTPNPCLAIRMSHDRICIESLTPKSHFTECHKMEFIPSPSLLFCETNFTEKPTIYFIAIRKKVQLFAFANGRPTEDTDTPNQEPRLKISIGSSRFSGVSSVTCCYHTGSFCHSYVYSSISRNYDECQPSKPGSRIETVLSPVVSSSKMESKQLHIVGLEIFNLACSSYH